MSGQLPLLRGQQRHQFKPAIKSTLLNNYDPSAYPPDLQFAQQHGLSQRVGYRIPMLQNVQRCRCCLQPIHKEQLPLLCDLSQLAHCGDSTPLYFTFVKQCILLLLFNSVILMMPVYLINTVMGTQCKEVNGASNGFFTRVCRGSVINIMNIEIIDAMQIQAIIFVVAIFANIVFIAFLQVRMQQYVAQLRRDKVDASDYSFMIKGLPSDITISQIQKYIQDKLLYSGAPDLLINKIYLIYNFKEYVVLVQNKQQLTEQLIQLKDNMVKLEAKNLHSIDYQQKLELQTRKTALDAEIYQTENNIEKTQIKITQFEALSNELASKLRNQGILQTQANKDILNFSGKCIVTVNNSRSRDIIIQTFKHKSCFHRFAYRLSQLLQGKKTKIVISSAPQPADIIFANIGSRKKVIWKTRIIYSLLIFFLVFLDFMIVATARKFLKEQKAIQQGNIIFSFINAIIVSLFCSIFRRIIRASQNESYYNSNSKLGYEIVAKLVLILEINMLFTTFVANVASFYLIHEDKPTFEVFPLNFESFLYDVFFLIVTNPLFSIVLVVIDHRYFRGLFKRYRISKNWFAVSQAQANLSYQNMNFDVCHKISTIYRFLLFTAGIAIIYPPSIAICAFALTILYWLDKYLLLRRYSITVKLTSRFSLMVQRIMNQFPIYLSLTNLLVMFIPIQSGKAFEQQKYSKVYYYLSAIAFALSFLNYMLGNTWLKNLIRSLMGHKNQDKMTNELFYKDIQNDLTIDYSHNYPYFRVSQQIGNNQNQGENIRKSKLKQLRDSEKLGIFQLLRSNMTHDRYT